MKKVIILTAALVFLLSTFTNSFSKVEPSNSGDSTKTKAFITKQVFNLDTTKLKSGDKFYQCEMHAKVLSNKAGSCPKCGMFLTEIKKK